MLKNFARIMLLLLGFALPAAFPAAAAEGEAVYDLQPLGFKVALPADLAVILQNRSTHTEKQLADDFEFPVNLLDL